MRGGGEVGVQQHVCDSPNHVSVERSVLEEREEVGERDHLKGREGGEGGYGFRISRGREVSRVGRGE